MPRRLPITVVCFHVGAVLAVAIAVATFVLGGLLRDVFGPGSGGDPLGGTISALHWFWSCTGVAFALLAVGLQVLVWGLRRRMYWAWILGIVVCGLQIASILQGVIPLAVLGGLGLWGLVDSETVVAFKPSPASATGAGRDADAG